MGLHNAMSMFTFCFAAAAANRQKVKLALKMYPALSGQGIQAVCLNVRAYNNFSKSVGRS